MRPPGIRGRVATTKNNASRVLVYHKNYKNRLTIFAFHAIKIYMAKRKKSTYCIDSQMKCVEK